MNNGYLCNTNKKLIHRVVWEEHHNACLLKWADVHHKNGIRDDNVWYNLEAMMKSRHSREYSGKKIDMTNRFCFICNGKTRIDRGYEVWFKNPLKKQELICRKCYRKIRRKLGLSN